MTSAGDASVQQDAELVILKTFSSQLGKRLVRRPVPLPGGTWVEVDGVDDDLGVFAEVFANVGPMKGGQKRKVALDTLKLVTLQRTHPSAHLVLVFCDESAKNSLTGWLDEAITTFGVKRCVVTIDPELRQRLIEVQVRQYR